MMSMVSASGDGDSLESALRSGLASGDAVTESIVPILRHVLASEDNSLFSDEIIARVRGMLRHLCAQLLDRLVQDEDRAPPPHDERRIAALSDMLLDSSELLGHLHSLALEWQLIQRTEVRYDVDPVLTSLLQTLIASDKAETARLAMRFLAAQVRYGQAQRRMNLPLLELPGDILHITLTAMRSAREMLGQSDERVEAAQARIRNEYDEAATRIGMASRLVSALGTDATSALSIRHAGVSVFLTALAMGAGLDRDMAVLSTHESQSARLVLALRATGLKGHAVLDQCLLLHPDLAFPKELDGLGADHAAAILAGGGSHPGT